MLRTSILAFTLASVAGAQSEWPSGLNATVTVPCVFEQDGLKGRERIARASGVLDIVTLPDTMQSWVEVTVIAGAIVDGPKGPRTLTSEVTLRSISAGMSNPFVTGFDHSLLTEGESVTACAVLFGGASRVVQRPVAVTARETLAAKDDDCLGDFTKAQQLKGLELRKQMTELIKYGCVKAIPENWTAKIWDRSSVNGIKVARGTFSEYDISPEHITGSILAADVVIGMKPFVEHIAAHNPK